MIRHKEPQSQHDEPHHQLRVRHASTHPQDLHANVSPPCRSERRIVDRVALKATEVADFAVDTSRVDFDTVNQVIGLL